VAPFDCNCSDRNVRGLQPLLDNVCPFFGIVIIHGGWNLFYDFTGLHGVMGQAFFWFTVIINPLIILIAPGIVVNYVARRMSGDNNVEL
jgi:hypothetical protein